MGLKPWREVAVPHEDVLKGSFQQAEFAADISRVHDGTATDEYQDPVLFFKRTFITEGMRLLLDSVVKRIAGKGGDPVIQLQTAFGGGKTHTLLAVYHVAQGKVNARDLLGIAPILDAAGVKSLPSGKVIVLDGVKMSPNQPKKRGQVSINTMWGELAWQLGADKAYDLVREADTSGTSPGKETLAKLITAYAPCVILIDELVAYIRQFEEGHSYTGGTFDSNISFIQALTEAMKAVPNAVLLASLPESDKEAGSQRGKMALEALEHYFARVQALWKPVATEEAFEIVKRRLFENIKNKKAISDICQEYVDYYVANKEDFPQETQESRYFERLVNAYPIHPEVFDRLYGDWSTLDNFQRTRGVLKLMAKVIHRLWNDNNQDLLIQPGNIPIYDASVRNEAIYYLPQGWDPVVEGDIDGERAETTEIEKSDPRLGSVQACRRSARTIFLGSAPSNSDQRVRGIAANRVILGCSQPGQSTSLYKDALRKLMENLHYLNSAGDKYWFDTRTNLRREMEERKRRFQDIEDVYPVVRSYVQKMLSGGGLGSIHVFTPSSDIPDDDALRLVALSPDARFAKNFSKIAIDKANGILKSRGEQPRQKQNRLIFIVADNDCVGRLQEQVRGMLAWQSIVDDIQGVRLNLDQLQARQASQSLNEAKEGILRMARETYKWLLVPMQEEKPDGDIPEIKWEHFSLNPGAANLSSEIERVLKENELMITDWSPIHLNKLLKKWFWKGDVHEASVMGVWQKMCSYLYLPRLKDEGVLRNTVMSGASSKDFFAIAYGKQGEKYSGFSLGKNVILSFDSSLLIVEPEHAAKYSAEEVPAEEAAISGVGGTSGGTQTTPTPTVAGGVTPGQGPQKRFYGIVELDPLFAKMEFARIVDEVIQHFTTKSDSQVRISVDIQAESRGGFDGKVQRTVKENCNVLKFKNAEFEKS